MADGISIESVEQKMVVEVKPGFNSESTLKFASRGHQKHAYFQSALIVKFNQVHTEGLNYVRNDDDLVYTHSLSLEDALMMCPVQIKTLDGRIMNISQD